MKLRLSAAILMVSAFALCSLGQSARATTVTIGTQDTTSLPAAFILAPTSTTGGFDLSVSGSPPNQYTSPFGDNTTLFSVISPGSGTSGSSNPGSATFVFGPDVTSVSFLWGSPDSYNSVAFYDSSDHLITAFTGSGLTPSAPGTGFDYVTFLATGGAIGSMVLSDTGQAAFEYDSVDPAPLPSSLLLLASGLAVLAFFAYRRKEKVAVSYALAA